jgi:hypothetical protein
VLLISVSDASEVAEAPERLNDEELGPDAWLCADDVSRLLTLNDAADELPDREKLNKSPLVTPGVLKAVGWRYG